MKEYIVSVQDDERDFEEVFIAYIREQTELIRCRECKHRPHEDKDGYIMPPDDDYTCPYVCDDDWYSRIPSDEQYCDRAEPKVSR